MEEMKFEEALKRLKAAFKENIDEMEFEIIAEGHREYEGCWLGCRPFVRISFTDKFWRRIIADTTRR